jgi:glycerate 2-kinase
LRLPNGRMPDAAGLRAAERIRDMVSGLSADDLEIALISGGGSSLLVAPDAGLTLADKQAVNAEQLKSGASISEMNNVRRHLSALKGGRLAAVCHPARLLSLLISDVSGDNPIDIASGPTVPDPTTCADALAIIDRYRIALPNTVRKLLESGQGETVKPGDPRLAGITRQVCLHGQPFTPPCVLLSGGETTVTLKGSGRGGRNVEFLLSLAVALDGLPGVHAIAGDTDGVDGAEEIAGACISPDTLARAWALGVNPRTSLDNNDGHGFFQALGDSVITGPTLTNVNDFRAIVIDGPSASAR